MLIVNHDHSCDTLYVSNPRFCNEDYYYLGDDAGVWMFKIWKLCQNSKDKTTEYKANH